MLKERTLTITPDALNSMITGWLTPSKKCGQKWL